MKLQVHKVREGSAVGSSGELPWGRTLMCARIRTAVEAAARSCGAYRRLPRDRLWSRPEVPDRMQVLRGTLLFNVKIAREHASELK